VRCEKGGTSAPPELIMEISQL